MLDQRMAFQLIEAQEALQEVAARDSLVRTMTTHVRRLIRHRGFACCFAALGDSRVRVEEQLAIQFPCIDLLALYQTERYLYSLVVDHWLRRNERAFLIGPGTASYLPPEYASICIRHGITNVVISGSLHRPMKRLFYCVFTNVQPAPRGDATLLVDLITPHIEAAFRSTLNTQERVSAIASENKVGLTHKQVRVLYGVVCGRTNLEIGKIEGLSENGVKYHIKRIFEKINVSNRAQAAAKGSEIFLTMKRGLM